MIWNEYPLVHRVVVFSYYCFVAVFLQTGCGKTESPERNVVAADSEANDTEWRFELIDGRRAVPFQDPDVKAIVLVFVATDCPIANAYQPTISHINREYSDRGIEFFLVHPNREITTAEAEAHASVFHIDVPIVLDTQLDIARSVGAEVTPQAVVIQRNMEAPVYRGAIDNQYAGYGKKRPVADKHYLVEAIESVLAGEPVDIQETKSVGCFIFFDEIQ